MVREKIENKIKEILLELGIKSEKVVLEHPADFKNGDYSTSVALIYAKELGTKPKDLAEKITKVFQGQALVEIERIEIASPGFINFYLSPKYFADNLLKIKKEGENFGKNKNLENKKIVVEFTDPNPFKEFHIGHLMSNTIGESIARLYEFSGAEVKRACYQGDVGMHVAKTVWGIIQNEKNFEEIKNKNIFEKVSFLGKCYAFGSKSEELAKEEITKINKEIFERSNKKINEIYDFGREWSLDYFETIYHRLGTKFDFYFFESESGPFGKTVVEDGLKNGIFEKSDGAIIWKGEDHRLHTRVFVNSQGLPTYEAKELGLAKIKADKYLYDESVVITGNEVNDYFKVLLAVMNLIYPDLAKKTKHIGHGMLRLPSGKMSSRTGDVITAESLLSAVEAMVHQKIADRELMTDEKNKIADSVAIGAIKYSILRQAIGGNIIFDFEKSISFEGDSGPYLQYAYTRANSVLEKVFPEDSPRGIDLEGSPREIGILEKLLARFPEIVERAEKEMSPHYIATYLIEIAGAFNSFYAGNKIIGSGKDESYRLALTSAFAITMKNGLYLLGIKAPEKM